MQKRLPTKLPRDGVEHDLERCLRIIYGPRSELLRCPDHEQELAVFARRLAPAANMVRDRLTFAVLDWHDEGGLIATADARDIDMERLEGFGEAWVYDVEGEQVLLEPGVPLLPVELSFGANTRRTINRISAKIGKPSARRVSCANLSRYCWIAVARRIIERE
ncbi:MAG: hypothetical protein AAFV54_03810 [Pseudomonadota bacterium]